MYTKIETHSIDSHIQALSKQNDNITIDKQVCLTLSTIKDQNKLNGDTYYQTLIGWLGISNYLPEHLHGSGLLWQLI